MIPSSQTDHPEEADKSKGERPTVKASPHQQSERHQLNTKNTPKTNRSSLLMKAMYAQYFES